MIGTEPAPCDDEVFAKGEPILAIDGWAKDIEPWVQKVAKLSGQRVDWHYSGGVAQVLFLGDRLKVMGAIEALERELVWIEPEASWFASRGIAPEREKGPRRNPTVMRRYGAGAPGLYRAGVTDAPANAIGCVTTVGQNEWIVSTDVPSDSGGERR